MNVRELPFTTGVSLTNLTHRPAGSTVGGVWVGVEPKYKQWQDNGGAHW